MSLKKDVKDLLLRYNPSLYVRFEYFRQFGKFPKLRNPENFNEKILWLILNWQHPLIVQCADKYCMRNYVESKGLGDFLPELYGVWTEASSIDWEGLPQSFVIKCNHGCKMNIICTDKNTLDINKATNQLDVWMQTNYGGKAYEPHYSHIKPLIMAEEYIDTGQTRMPVDYKIYCFNGTPELIMACVDRDIEVKFEWYDFDWNVLEIGAEKNERRAKRPVSLDRMIDIARTLSSEFPYVRVDFYEREGEPIIGELTFTPYYGMAHYYSEDGCLWLGTKLSLPPKYSGHFV